MAYYPQSASGLNYATSPSGPTAAPTQLTSGGSSNTKGSYVQFFASTAFTCNAVLVDVTRCSVSTRHLIDVATGPGGSETVVISNILTDNSNATTSHAGRTSLRAPLKVASGTRIACANQSSGTSQTAFLAITIIAAGGVDGITSLTTYGADTSTSGGTVVDPGGSANTKGSYAQLTASTSAVAQWAAVLCAYHAVSPAASVQWAVDLATGPGGSETVLVPDVRVSAAASGGPFLSFRGFDFLTYIAASTRLAVAASCDVTSATDRKLDVALICGVAPSEPSGGSSEHSAVFG